MSLLSKPKKLKDKISVCTPFGFGLTVMKHQAHFDSPCCRTALRDERNDGTSPACYRCNKPVEYYGGRLKGAAVFRAMPGWVRPPAEVRVFTPLIELSGVNPLEAVLMAGEFVDELEQFRLEHFIASSDFGEPVNSSLRR